MQNFACTHPGMHKRTGACTCTYMYMCAGKKSKHDRLHGANKNTVQDVSVLQPHRAPLVQERHLVLHSCCFCVIILC